MYSSGRKSVRCEIAVKYGERLMQLIPLLPKPKVLLVKGGGPSKLYQDIQDGLWPPPVKDGKSSFWPENECAVMNAAKIAGKSAAEIKVLVASLVAQRKTVLHAA